MLKNLSIENIAVIEKADINFTEGLNILTGETGAGKSIIIDSINAVLGERTTRNLVRNGAASARVTALFENINEQVKSALSQIGVESEQDGTLLINRTVSADGKSSCRINGLPATASMLKTVAGQLINIHGQHDSQQLLNPATHGIYIDQTAGISALLDEYREIYSSLKQIKKEITALTVDEEEKAKKIDLLKYQTEELTAAQIKPGEREELDRIKARYSNAEKVTAGLNEAYRIIKGFDDSIGAADMVRNASQSVLNSSQHCPELEKTAASIEEICYSLENIASELQSSLDEYEFNEQEREQVEERLDLLYNLSQKYGETEQDMLNYLENAQKELADIQMSDEKINELQGLYSQKLEKAKELAFKISDIRNKTGKEFAKKVKDELVFLDMPNVEFIVNNEENNVLTPNGIDKIEFLICANAGETPKPLSKVASGGELSRVMLAIKNVLADKDSVETLIFDEVDTGVSGRAAQKIAQKLKQVSSGKQVICVTHLAQIAAYADNHLLIEKRVENNATFTGVTSLDFEKRKQEIARIISGADITPLTLENAQEMLKLAGING